MRAPQVSVVIPTRNRPELVARAVESALAQTYKSIEVIVVIDGRDAATEIAMYSMDAERVSVISLPTSLGGSHARNIGVEHARGEWIAFLDDDDTWASEKIEEQIAATDVETNFVSCKAHISGLAHSAILPSRFPRDGEAIGDYLFCRHTLHQKTFLQTSTFLIRRSLLQATPFSAGLKKHQDWDWLLRVSADGKLKPVFLERAMVTYHAATSGSVGKGGDWLTSYRWALDHHNHGRLSRRAYSYFIATQCVSRLRGSLSARLSVATYLARLFFVDGQPSFASSLLFLGFFVRGM